MIPLCRAKGAQENHFNLLRMLAACAVIYSHSYAICLGTGAEEPLSGIIVPYNLGRFAVWTFFIISGYFITASFERRHTLYGFVAARIIRLYPGLLAALTVTAFIIGPAVSHLASGEYFSTPAPTWYVLRGLTLKYTSSELPGVFTHLPLPEAVNGSLWTLMYEVLCYAMVPFVALCFRSKRAFLFFCLMFAGLHAMLEYARLYTPGFTEHQLTAKLHELTLPFICGMAFYRFRFHIPHSLPLFVACLLLILLTREIPFYREIFVPLWGYIVMFIGFLPSRLLAMYNRLGDYSYGTYLYAFPVQQALVQIYHGISPQMLAVAATALTIAFGAISWHWVEKPALALKESKRLRPPALA